MNCNRCETELKAGDVVCPSCGLAIARAIAQPSGVRHLFIGASGAAVIGILFWMFAPEDRLAAAGDMVRKFTSPNVHQCAQLARSMTRDPESFRFVKAEIVGDGIELEYRARNGFGAYVPGDLHCALADGKVSDVETSIYYIRLSTAALRANKPDLSARLLEVSQRVERSGWTPY